MDNYYTHGAWDKMMYFVQSSLCGQVKLYRLNQQTCVNLYQWSESLPRA